MKRVLVTGASGFVGKHLLNFLSENSVEVWGTARKVPFLLSNQDVKWVPLALDNQKNLEIILSEIKPDFIFHLAGQSSVKSSWDDKYNTFQVNVIGTINLFNAILRTCPEAKIIAVGSSEEYGIVDELMMPIDENFICNPANPYGLSKFTISMLAKQYHRAHGLKVVHTRPFNHIGVGQDLGFVASDFAKQIVSIELGLLSNPITVGNLDASRDFTDVRDIVSAYWALAQLGKDGEVYNVCSGRGIRISTILQEFADRSNVNIEIQQDITKFRPIDVPIYIGSYRKLYEDTGWEPSVNLSRTFSDIIDDWRKRLKGV